MTGTRGDFEKPEIERLRREFGERQRPGRDVGPCPDPEALWVAVAGETDAAEVEELVLHTAACPACATAWRLAMEVQEAGGQTVRSAPGPVRKSRSAWPRRLALAAAAILVMATTGIIVRQIVAPPVDSTISRDRPTRTIESLIPADRPIPRDQLLLRATPLGDPDSGWRYEINLSDGRLVPLAAARDLLQPEFQVPVSELADLPPGAVLFWQVTAVAPDGTRRSSPTFRVVLD